MSKRSKFEVPVQFFKVAGANSYRGGESVPFPGTYMALVSFGSTPYSAEEDKTQGSVNPTEGDRFGAIRIFLKAVPEGLQKGDRFILPTMANREFEIVAPDLRGVLPGRYPYRIEARGE